MGDPVVMPSLLQTWYRDIDCSSHRPVGDAESFWLTCGRKRLCEFSSPPQVELCRCQPTCNRLRVKGGHKQLLGLGLTGFVWFCLSPIIHSWSNTSFVFASKGVTFQEVKAKICCIPALFILVVWVFLENTLQNFSD